VPSTRILVLRVGVAICACAAAAPAIASQRTYVSINAGGRILRVKPSNIHVLSNENLYNLHWSAWGGPQAKGSGMDSSTFPSRGRSQFNPVRVQLTNRKRCGSKLVYTTLRIRFTHGIPYAHEPSLISYSYGCPR
jgi:hypothetical protein